MLLFSFIFLTHSFINALETSLQVAQVQQTPAPQLIDYFNTYHDHGHVALSPNGKLALTYLVESKSGNYYESACFRTVNDGVPVVYKKMRRQIERDAYFYDTVYRQIQFSKNNKSVLSASRSRAHYFHIGQSLTIEGKEIEFFEFEKVSIRKIAINNDGTYGLIATDTGVYIVNLSSGSLARVLSCNKEAVCHSVGFVTNHSGCYAVAGFTNGMIAIYDTKKHEDFNPTSNEPYMIVEQQLQLNAAEKCAIVVINDSGVFLFSSNGGCFINISNGLTKRKVKFIDLSESDAGSLLQIESKRLVTHADSSADGHYSVVYIGGDLSFHSDSELQKMLLFNWRTGTYRLLPSISGVNHIALSPQKPYAAICVRKVIRNKQNYTLKHALILLDYLKEQAINTDFAAHSTSFVTDNLLCLQYAYTSKFMDVQWPFISDDQQNKHSMKDVFAKL